MTPTQRRRARRERQQTADRYRGFVAEVDEKRAAIHRSSSDPRLAIEKGEGARPENRRRVHPSWAFQPPTRPPQKKTPAVQGEGLKESNNP